MSGDLAKRKWLLAAVALAACATAPLASEEPGCETAAEAVLAEEACANPSRLIALCAGEQCGLYRCEEVKEHLALGRVVLARGAAAVLPNPAAGAQRNWGSAQELPQDTRPVFIIPWRHRPPLLPSQQQMLDEAAKERRKPHGQHHIFPRMFKGWFTEKGINIDEYVILLGVEKHRSIHRGAKGGPWNDAWDRFIQARRATATREEIHKYAGQLIYEFELFGPVMRFKSPPPPLPPGY
ncbi:TIGR02269 family lipoprotein [Hyalangium minutum]|uniref:SitA6 family polymorphic toxin lipoprotein n=1 Tax=Hyalangium minutum TaxID=394096 RepID=UPI000A05C079|nr:TIGR02269 family lipoprotein [Hyalangium minutum]